MLGRARIERELCPAADLTKRHVFADTDPVEIGKAIRAEGSADGVAGVFVLPPASANPGVTVAVVAKAIATAGTIDVKDAAGNAGGAGEIVSAIQFTATGDYAVLKSDGVTWWVLASVLTT